MWIWAMIPIVFALTGTVGFWAVFGMAVSNGSVNLTQEFPYISTCGSYTPQSCVFAQILNLGSLLVVWITLMRFQQIKDSGQHSRTNTASLVLGLICSLGTSFVGNFQQTVLMGAHLFGAFLAFFVGVAYFWVQVYLTYTVKPCHGGRWIFPVRIVLCSTCTGLIIIMSVLHNLGFRTQAALCEWGAAMAFFLLFGLFFVEFRHMDCQSYHVLRKRATTPVSRELS
ncbi:modulator of macroautophagy TMEM150B-like [Acipenser oxyrinchus oxyrinchus]|uniref:Modulator of macroautophagy TMEM150B-like n=1 Tax=Acipenser oxyrinchus oxyrinchus TaxID=40147 RepID=A0AAD8FS81_ACIOX|nr:modulator of macroautophagy TMEM150B-like [Acipenser oxyrinchus oxyrinchus]